ncbi:MAG TPA: penicillin acylase family protein [Ferruginibacter sp.]|nr:penicillin acylase family protein [Ferruginibacter sp.]HMP20475.1 penicillin acylase family protein [Ferruginibacter sp.]
MRILLSIITAAVTVTLIVILNSTLLLPAPLGKLLSPQHGIWQNAEAVDANFSADLNFPQLAGKVDVYFDDRLVPHIFAEQENDAYFVQGYLHAKFRLWQMELQTHAAAGRASEIIGIKALKHDREFRRMGMGYAAEVALKEMEKDPAIKAACDAYTAGVNAWVNTLTESSLPVEYKLIGYKPELWSNLKTMLFLKYMSYDLAGGDDDFEMTKAKNYFSTADFNLLYPLQQDSLDPIIPKGTKYEAPKLQPTAPATADSLYFNDKQLLAMMNPSRPDRDNGSNNWAVAPSKTKNGAPILCNDPHLGLNLPSLWYEMQITTPAYNAYGVSFPGAPAIIIGFNDSCAFGFTNGGRDVKEYYSIQFKDDSRKEYWFNNEWKKTDFRIEHIKVKDSLNYTDTVAYTVFGPVMYDKSFNGGIANGNYYALRWTAHDPSNELRIFYELDRAKNYTDYSNAVLNLHTPGQNCVFATKSGDIAIRTQGKWPAKWKGQGDFIMPGTDGSYLWQGFIPMDETPQQYNPERGFVSSGNQKPADSTYPYYLGRNYPPYRGLIINKKLQAANNITAQDMMDMQVNNDNAFAAQAVPLFLRHINDSLLDNEQNKYLDMLRDWHYTNDATSNAATVFAVLWNKFSDTVLADEFRNAPAGIMRPFESTLLEALHRDTACKFVDNIETVQTETLTEMATAAFTAAVTSLRSLEAAGKLEWSMYQATGVRHLAKLDPFSRLNLPIGGSRYSINATKPDHGPSWRMVISLTADTEAYGVYPGGQSGNPGSRFYDTFVNHWVQGRYYRLWVMKPGAVKDARVKWKMRFSKA